MSSFLSPHIIKRPSIEIAQSVATDGITVNGTLKNVCSALRKTTERRVYYADVELIAQQSGKTVRELYDHSGFHEYDWVATDEDMQHLLKALDALPDSVLDEIEAVIPTLCTPWWEKVDELSQRLSPEQRIASYFVTRTLDGKDGAAVQILKSFNDGDVKSLSEDGVISIFDDKQMLFQSCCSLLAQRGTGFSARMTSEELFCAVYMLKVPPRWAFGIHGSFYGFKPEAERILDLILLMPIVRRKIVRSAIDGMAKRIKEA